MKFSQNEIGLAREDNALAARLTALAAAPELRDRLGTAARDRVASYTPERWAQGARRTAKIGGCKSGALAAGSSAQLGDPRPAHARASSPRCSSVSSTSACCSRHMMAITSPSRAAASALSSAAASPGAIW